MGANQEIFSREGLSIISDIRLRISSTGAYATGKTSASLEEKSTDQSLTILGGKSFGINDRDKKPYVEAGRGPGKQPAFADIRDWAIARGIVSNGTGNYNKGVIWGIITNIKNKGTKSWQSRSVRDIVSDVITNERITYISELFAESYANQFSSSIIDGLNSLEQ